MSHFISFSSTSIPATGASINFESGTITYGSTDYFLSGQADEIQSLSILTSVSTTLFLRGESDSIIILPANKYITITSPIKTMKIKSSTSFDLWCCASTTETGIQVT